MLASMSRDRDDQPRPALSKSRAEGLGLPTAWFAPWHRFARSGQDARHGAISPHPPERMPSSVPPSAAWTIFQADPQHSSDQAAPQRALPGLRGHREPKRRRPGKRRHGAFLDAGLPRRRGRPSRDGGAAIGYARVSTGEQDLAPQRAITTARRRASSQAASGRRSVPRSGTRSRAASPSLGARISGQACSMPCCLPQTPSGQVACHCSRLLVRCQFGEEVLWSGRVQKTSAMR